MQIYSEEEILRAKLDILDKTNMIDYVIDIRCQLYSDKDIPEVCYVTYLSVIYRYYQLRVLHLILFLLGFKGQAGTCGQSVNGVAERCICYFAISER